MTFIRNSKSCSSNKFRQLIAALSTLFLLWLPTQLADACGPVTARFRGYSFINPKIVDNETATYPFFAGFESLAQLGRKNVELQSLNNSQEWNIKICENALEEDIRQVIYRTDQEELNLLRTAALSKNMPIPIRLRSNTFAKYLHRNKCVETIDYLLYAKACEPHVTIDDPWATPKRDTIAMQGLIEEGLKAFRKTDSHYIRLRYAYQIVRLAHYTKAYQRCLELYDYLLPKIDVATFDGKLSLIYYWMLGHKAGALMALGRNVEASYLYAIIFQKCPSRRQSAFQSTRLKSDEDWANCMRLCQDDRERAMLFAIRANARDSRALEEMRKIHELDPTNPDLEVLMVKEIKELEKDLLGIEFNNNKGLNERLFNRPRAGAGDYVIELQKFAREIRLANDARRTKFWQMAEGYLQLIAGDYYAARLTLLEVKEVTTNPALLEQINVLLIAQKIALLEGVNDSIEQVVYDIRLDEPLYRKYPDFADFLRDRLTKLYEEYDEPGKAFICQHDLRVLRFNPQKEIIDDLLKTATKPDRNSLEILMTTDTNGQNITNALWDLKATLYMQAHNYEAALEIYKEIPRDQWNKFGVFDPFRPTVRDCFSCPHSRDSIDQFNKGEFLEEILDLQYRSKAELGDNATFFLKIGVGLYNASYFGHSWKLMDYFRDGTNWNKMRTGRTVFSYPGAALGNKEMLDVSQALYFFERARIAATDPEQAAKATYMAAKCELAQFYQSPAYEPPPCCNQIPAVPEEYSTNYKRLKDHYSETRFYEELLEECQFFRVYALK
ncbi:MAG: hypothetical protein KDC44_05530 [Phaeodactylibacter sp.]|nr:hypothetical protein [Phaeodactylibacter sp.]